MPMAKGQKRSSREIKKPKAKKPATAEVGSPAFRHGMTTPILLPKKKG
jgi:hypothetical protein